MQSMIFPKGGQAVFQSKHITITIGPGSQEEELNLFPKLAIREGYKQDVIFEPLDLRLSNAAPIFLIQTRIQDWAIDISWFFFL